MTLLELTTEVASSAADGIPSAHGLPGGGAVVGALLKSLLAVQDAQLESLERIDANVQRLVNAPWEAARMHLENITFAKSVRERIQDDLAQASTLLYQAASMQEKHSFARAYVYIDLALVLRMSGDEGASAKSARDALVEGRGYLEGVSSKPGNRPPGYKSRVRKVAVGNTYLTMMTYGIARAVRPKPSGAQKFDDWCNAWLRDVYTEFDAISAAAATLTRGVDDQVALVAAGAPRDLTFSWGRLRKMRG